MTLSHERGSNLARLVHAGTTVLRVILGYSSTATVNISLLIKFW